MTLLRRNLNYTECFRRNGSYFGRTFWYNYMDITNYTYILSLGVMEIMVR